MSSEQIGALVEALHRLQNRVEVLEAALERRLPQLERRVEEMEDRLRDMRNGGSSLSSAPVERAVMRLSERLQILEQSLMDDPEDDEGPGFLGRLIGRKG